MAIKNVKSSMDRMLAVASTPPPSRRMQAARTSWTASTCPCQQQPDGSWKLYRDIFNSNVPPASPADDLEAVTAAVEVTGRILGRAQFRRY
ncbi:MAG: hypothetical protein R2854_17125 [Caldilineaceae bacterium]